VYGLLTACPLRNGPIPMAGTLAQPPARVEISSYQLSSIAPAHPPNRLFDNS
jgi:hypothetical protein